MVLAIAGPNPSRLDLNFVPSYRLSAEHQTCNLCNGQYFMSGVEPQVEPLSASKRGLAFGLTVLPQPTALIMQQRWVNRHLEYDGNWMNKRLAITHPASCWRF